MNDTNESMYDRDCLPTCAALTEQSPAACETKALYRDEQGLCKHAMLVWERREGGVIREAASGLALFCLGTTTVRGWGEIDGECEEWQRVGASGLWLVPQGALGVPRGWTLTRKGKP